MEKITAIKLQKKNNKRFNIYIDGDFAFGVSEDVLIVHQLSVGKELSSAFVNEVILAEEQNAVNNYALRLLGYRARSEYEIRNRLTLKGYENSMIENAIQFLKKHGYVDDYAFARALVNDELNLRQNGKGLIQQKLYQKGISKEICQKVLDETINEDESFSRCVELVKKKSTTTYKDDTQTDKTRKLFGFLQRRGYSYDTIRKAIEKVLGEEDFLS